jgi:PqqD family protein of HPr-rel-A system
MMLPPSVTDETYLRMPELPFRTLGEETVVVNTRTREVHVLNGTGSRIWNLLAPPRTVADLLQALEGEFDLDPATARAEVTAFVGDLVDKGLVTVSRRGAG